MRARFPFVIAVVAAFTLPTVSAQEADLRGSISKCAAVADSLQRLVCYDAIAKNAGASATASGAAALPFSGLTSTPRSSATPETATRSTARQQCAATTKKGTRCSRLAQPGSSYCWQHQR